MGLTLSDCQLAEILIERHKHETVREGVAQDFLVAWVLLPITNPLNFMPFLP